MEQLGASVSPHSEGTASGEQWHATCPGSRKRPLCANWELTATLGAYFRKQMSIL